MTKNISFIQTRVEDVPLVGTLLLHPVLSHSLLPTLAARNERELRPQSLRDPMWGQGPKSSHHIWLSILIFINYYKFLILWTMKLNELYTKKTCISLFLNHEMRQWKVHTSFDELLKASFIFIFKLSSDFELKWYINKKNPPSFPI